MIYDFFTPQELSCFLVLEMIQCVVPRWDLLGNLRLRRNLPARGEFPSFRGLLGE